MDAVRDEIGAVESTTKSEVDPPAQADVLWFKGKKWSLGAARPPRYVWYPENVLPGDPYKGDEGGSQPSAATGEEGVTVECWGVDEDQSWELRRRLIVAAKTVALVDCKYLGCQVVRAASGENDFGVVYATRLSFGIPVTEEPLAPVTITGYESTTIAVIDGVEFVAATH